MKFFLSVLLGGLGALVVPLPSSKEGAGQPIAYEFPDLDFSAPASLSEIGKPPLIEFSADPEKENRWARTARPYDGVFRKSFFTWTAIDGKNPRVMHSLATDEEMLRRLYEEDSYVRKRQLVYLDASFSQALQEVADGLEKTLELPDLDGQTFTVRIEEVAVLGPEDLHLSGTVEGAKMSLVQLGLTTRGVAISVFDGQRLLRYQDRQEDAWILNEIDQEAYLRQSSRRIKLAQRDAAPL